MKLNIVLFLLGLLLGSLLVQSTSAQNAVILYGVSSGAPVPILVDANGNLNIVSH